MRRLDATEVPAMGALPEGYIVKSTSEEAWSGSGPGDPETPELGHVLVYTLAEAHRFDDIAEALEEAYTYRGGAYIMQGARVVAETGPR